MRTLSAHLRACPRAFTAGLFLLLGLFALSSQLSAPLCAQQAAVSKSLAAATLDQITSDLKFGTGRTGTFLAGSTLTLNGALGGTPTGGTLNLAALTLTLPADFVTLTGTQTLTNKTLSGASNTFSAIPNAALGNSSLTIGSTSVSLGGTAATLAGLTLTAPNLGTPSAATLTNATGLPIATGVSGLGTGVATFLATPTSANLATAITNETGSGSLVFATLPTLTTPVLGAATATSITGAAATNLTLTAGSGNQSVVVVGTGTGATASGVGTGGLNSANFGLSTSSGGASFFGGAIRGAGINDVLLLSGGGTSPQYVQHSTSGGNYYYGVSNSAGAGLLSGAGAYSFAILSESARNLALGTNNTLRLLIDGTTGAATFAGSVSVSGTTATWTSGTGSPESVKTAPVGSLYTRTDGGASTTLYVKESGSGNTGWVAK